MINENSLIEVGINSKNVNFYKNIGYDITCNTKVKILLKDIQTGSRAKIIATCDFCDNTKEIEYKTYKTQTKNNKPFACSRKCGNNKSKITSLEKYGVDNPSKSTEIKDKIKNIILHKYGVDSYSKTDEFKEKCKNTNLEKYGVDSYSKTDEYTEKVKKTSIEKYGVNSYSKTDEFKEKCKNTNLEKYGVDSYSKTDEFKEKCKNTNLEKYGVDNPGKSDFIKDKIEKIFFEKYGLHPMKTQNTQNNLKETIKLKYGTDFYLNSIESKSKNFILYGADYYLMSDTFKQNKDKKIDLNRSLKINDDEYEYLKYENCKYIIHHNKCNKTFECDTSLYYNRKHIYNITICTNCNPIIKLYSHIEVELSNYLNGKQVNHICSYRDKYELDLYIPDMKIGIEVNGLYWHSDKFKDNNYHINKMNYFNEKGIKIINIWEDDWNNKKDIILSILNNKLNLNTSKIYSRQCDIKIIDTKTSKQFLIKNHIQGSCNSNTNYGLYFNNELVSLMTFGDRWLNSKRRTELLRFANKMNTNVIGASSKLLKYFIKNNKFDEILSFSDNSIFDGNMYKKIGFTEVENKTINYWWVVNNIRKHRFNYNKKRLVKLGYNNEKTENEIMKSLGHYKIYGHGHKKWIINNNNLINQA